MNCPSCDFEMTPSKIGYLCSECGYLGSPSPKAQPKPLDHKEPGPKAQMVRVTHRPSAPHPTHHESTHSSAPQHKAHSQSRRDQKTPPPPTRTRVRPRPAATAQPHHHKPRENADRHGYYALRCFLATVAVAIIWVEIVAAQAATSSPVVIARSEVFENLITLLLLGGIVATLSFSIGNIVHAIRARRLTWFTCLNASVLIVTLMAMPYLAFAAIY